MQHLIKILSSLFLMIVVIETKAMQDSSHLRIFSVQELLSDYDSLHKIITDNHPALWADADSSVTEQRWKEIRKKINQPMKRWEFVELVAPATTQYNDGHTALTYDFDFEEVEQLIAREGKLFPYRVKLYDDTLWITENWKDSSSLYRGLMVQSINGVSAKEIIQRIWPVVPADYYRMREASLSRLFPFLLWSLYGWENSYEIVLHDPYQQKNTTIKTAGITMNGFFQRQFPKKKWNLQLFKEQQLAIISCSSYNNYAEAIRFIDSAFAVIKQENIQHLAFDIRNNGGGNSSIGDHLLAYIAQQPYIDVYSKTLRNGSMMRRFKENSGMYRVMQNFIKNGIQQGNNYTMRFQTKALDTTIKKENIFRGKFYLLTGPVTYSSAHMTALAVKSAGLGTIIGEPTGERIDLTGENASFTLPNTRLYGYCSLAVYEGAVADKKSKGVQPTIFIPFRPSALLSGKDPVIDKLMELIK
jgi:hypothetical protein